MKKSEWSDKQLEELLRQMPKIKDHRNPRDIYQNLSLKRRKKPAWILPAIASAAAVLLIIILIPKILVSNQISMDQADEKSSKKMELLSDKQEKPIEMKKGESSSKALDSTGTEKYGLIRGMNPNTAAYEGDVGNRKVLTYWIPDHQGQILIPVSTIVNRKNNQSWMSLFNEYMAQLKEEKWGLSDFYPMNATLSLNEKGDSVNVDVPKDHPYGQGANETIFVNAIKKDISTNSHVKRIRFSTNRQPGIELGNYGHLEELNAENERQRAFFLYVPRNQNKPFLVPSQGKYNTLEAAFVAMKKDQSEGGLKASILPAIKFKTILIRKNTLFLTLKEKSMLEDSQNTIYSIEALLLTAKEFGIKSVFILNSPIKQVGNFDLTKEIKVPLAPNLRSTP
ncbi:negative regulator of sigma-X activity [Bacillus salipaludis]|uniref:negative regulator of sigma-X activity n=1 Tax=Bacillus salipaludis TaxID=2547811 RepID=UPI003D20CC00